MLANLRKVLKREYQSLNIIEISKKQLLDNYAYLSLLNEKIRIAPVLKSNAYGHGIKEVARVLDSQNAPYFCVDSLYEAYELYKSQIKTPILIMGYTDPQNLSLKKLPFSYAVWDINTARILNEYQKGASVHLKVDTGMNRLGVQIHELNSLLKEMKTLSNLNIVGLMSHLASAESLSDPIFNSQITNFHKAVEICRSNNIDPKWKHISASKAILDKEIRELISKECNLARTGIALYGITDNINHPNLKPVLILKSKIAQIKNIKKGERVGYDGTFQAAKDMVLGILPIGYYDGIDRRLSNKGCVLVDNTVCQIVGRVSMNITTIDLTHALSPRINQEVVIFSNHTNDTNSIENSAKLCETIPYELLVHLVSSTKRIVV